MSDDPTNIVTRLRGLWQDNDCISTLMEQAADEIERLRAERSNLRMEIDRMVDKLTAQRDAARREVCESRAACIQGKMPQQIAKALGWDCFKETP